ncbi:hypothetical protein HPP92_001958 [Vanilla planifolia]|uniref:Syntaxin N-terminal domain-containing protein n=1 Tax=Vanilla planifolia TaxID=51239 RepID=A0A835S598_VANPL|nr:hypothetical protein HPP92_001958 [Vanilla planifolia]
MNNLMTRSFLSYADLKKEAVKDIEAGGDRDDEWPDIETSNVDKTLKTFFVEAGLVKEEMASIRDLLALLESANQESKTACKMEETRAIRGRINGHIVEVLKKARRIRERLEAMDSANAANRGLSGCREGTRWIAPGRR